MNATTYRRALVAGLLAVLTAVPASAQEAPDDKAPKDNAPKEKAKDDRPVSTDAAAKLAIDRFNRDFRSRDEGKRMNAIYALSQTKNDLVTKKLGQLLRHNNEVVRAGAAMSLDDQYNNAELAGEILRKYLKSKKENDVDVLINICLSVGRISYGEAIPELGELAEKNGNAFVKIEALKTFGKMKDTRALLPILRMWLKEPQGYSWEGGEVTYDSGAPGDADQKEAEKQYKEKYGNQGRRGAPPTMLKTYIQAIADAVKEICGKELENPTQLMEWMVEHEKELPYELPSMVRSTLKDYKERAAKRAKKDKKNGKDKDK